MFKLIRRIICLVITLAIIIIALAIWKGGEGFRWFGKKTEQTGKTIEKFGDTVDEIKEDKEKAKEKAKETLKQLKEKIK